MLCVSAYSPWWQHKASAGHRSAQAQDKNGKCAPIEPRLHTRSMQKCTRRQSQQMKEVILQDQSGCLQLCWGEKMEGEKAALEVLSL